MRGTLISQGCCNHLQHTICVAEDVIVPEPQDSIIALPEPTVARAIRGVIRMLSAINFHNQPMFAADKIHDVWSDRFLAHELAAIDRARAQAIP